MTDIGADPCWVIVIARHHFNHSNARVIGNQGRPYPRYLPTGGRAMKKFRMLLWIAATLAIGLIFIQNQGLYMTEQKLSLNLFLYEISFPTLQNGVIILLAFFSGVVLAAMSSLFGRLEKRNALKKCRAIGEGYLEKIGELKVLIEQMKSGKPTRAAVFKSPQGDRQTGP
jgi:uncharacterized integral membrane protein